MFLTSFRSPRLQCGWPLLTSLALSCAVGLGCQRAEPPVSEPKQRTAAAGEGFACPMHCEPGKVYPASGICPVCKMKLEEVHDGHVAHADHSPKHGGIFFMASDQWHHLEGTLPAAHEVRIYLYDNFTHPIPADGYRGRLTVEPVDEQGETTGGPVEALLEVAPDKSHLIAKLPDNLRPPYQIEARLKFPGGDQEQLFNFDFQGVQHEE